MTRGEQREESCSRIHVAVTADERYSGIAGAVIVSVLKKTRNRPICFHILESGFRQKSRDRISSLKKQFPNGEFLFYPVNDTSMFDGLKLPDYISRAATLRLFLPELLKDVAKVLYLDCDTIVCRDIGEIWDTPLENVWVAGVLDCSKSLTKHCNVLGLRAEHYFNSGVLLMNLGEMRNTNYRETFSDVIRNYADKITMADQDLLNLAAQGRYRQLPIRWNLHRGYLIHQMPWTDKAELAEALRMPGIVHFTGSRKPWQWSLKYPRHIFWQEWFLAAKGTTFAQPVLFLFKRFLALFWRKRRPVFPGAPGGA